MKRNKITAVILSIVMSMSMMMSSFEVMADETSAPSETQTTESSEKKEPNTTEKQASEATEKQEPKETEKQASEATENQEPKETEKQQPVETEKEEPEETKPQESIEVKKEPSVTDDPGYKTEAKRKAANALAAEGTCGENLIWTLDDEGTLTISGSGAMEDYDVRHRPSFYQYRNDIKTIIIKENVTTIGICAFVDFSAATSVSIPDSVLSIGECAFQDCGLRSIIIPDSVTTIGPEAFHFCGNLETVKFLGGVTTIGDGAFRWCDKLTDISFPNSLKVIESGAFHFCEKLTSVTIPISVKEIDAGAFEHCPLKNVYYLGTKAEWNSIDIKELDNEDLLKANIHFLFAVTINDPVNGSAKLSKVRADTGDTISVLVTPNNGYELDVIEVNGSAISGNTFTMTDQDTTVVVTFKKTEYSIKLLDVANGTAVVSHTKAGIGDEITVTVTPDTGYELVAIKVNGDSIIGNTFIMTAQDTTIEVVIAKEAKQNTLTVSGKTAKVKYKKLRKKAQTVGRSKVLAVSNAQGKVTYSLVSVKRGKSKKYKKYFKINATTGNVTVKKKLKKGTYSVTCRVTAAGDVEYKGVTKTVSFKIKVK